MEKGGVGRGMDGQEELITEEQGPGSWGPVLS